MDDRTLNLEGGVRAHFDGFTLVLTSKTHVIVLDQEAIVALTGWMFHLLEADLKRARVPS